MFRTLIVFCFVLMLGGCTQNYSPKPRGYFRIDLPEKQYQRFDNAFPYSFEHPVYSEFIPDTRQRAEPYWGNLEFPQFKAVVYLSYKPVNSTQDLEEYFEDARTFVNKHIPKATALNDHMVVMPGNNVFGMFHEIKGREAASPLQFYVTDSLDHFLRGALYFSVTPNNDSLSPVISYIQDDILHMLATLRWE